MKDKIIKILFDSIDAINKELKEADQLKKSLDTELFSQEGGLDSLSLVSFIILVERNIEEFFGKLLTLADEEAMNRENSPFKNVASLAAYIEERLVEDENTKK